MNNKKRVKTFEDNFVNNFEKHRNEFMESTKELRQVPIKRLQLPIR